MNKKVICYIAGKSGGHIIPCLTLLKEEKQKNPYLKILFFSANTLLDQTILSTNKNISWHIMLPLRSRQGNAIKVLYHLLLSFFTSLFYLHKYKPESVLTTGGIIAIAPCLAAFILRIPITLFSLDAVPGKAIRILTWFATHVTTCFTTSKKYFPAYKYSFKDYPIRFQTSHPRSTSDKNKILFELGLSRDKKTIVLLGGSQGSLFLNQSIKQWADSSLFDPLHIQIIHQVGNNDKQSLIDFYSSKNISAYVFSYDPNLLSFYTLADLIICRAGAGTLFEVKFFNKQCIVIPLITHTTDHQVANAYAMMIEYPELFHTLDQSIITQNPHILFQKINQLLFL